MTLADGLVMWVHLTCASIWVGGSIFLGIVLAPMLKAMTRTIEERVALMVKVGRRFNNIALPAFGILIVTGIYNSHSFFQDPTALLETSYGIILLIKIILVIATLITYIIYIRILNTTTERKIESGISGSVYIQSVRSKIINLGRITVVMSVTILLLAALLHSGGLS